MKSCTKVFQKIHKKIIFSNHYHISSDQKPSKKKIEWNSEGEITFVKLFMVSKEKNEI